MKFSTRAVARGNATSSVLHRSYVMPISCQNERTHLVYYLEKLFRQRPFARARIRRIIQRSLNIAQFCVHLKL